MSTPKAIIIAGALIAVAILIRMAGRRIITFDSVIELVMLLASAPAFAVAVVAYSFNVDAISFLASLSGENARQLWIVFWDYAHVLMVAWAIVLTLIAWQTRKHRAARRRKAERSADT